jgi:hypothetical protein
MADKITDRMSESDDRIARWDDEDRYWSEHASTRPYFAADRGYEYYRPAYQYGWESAQHHRGREWNDVEPELERDWSSRGARSTWQDIKAAVRDAWDRVTGGDDKAARERMGSEMNRGIR